MSIEVLQITQGNLFGTTMVVMWFSAIGASANVIVVGIAEKMGKPISFEKFMRYGMPLMIELVLICTLYVWLRYYILQI